MIDLLNRGKITSGFGSRRSPTAGASTNHKGIDIVLTNDDIPSVMAGTVSYVGYSSSSGNMVSIKQEDGTTASYMHLANASPLSIGDKVKEGQIIGVQGNTGISTGKHLHFQVESNSGTYIDPEEYLSGAVNTMSPYYSSNLSPSSDSDNDLFSGIKSLVGNIISFLAAILIAVLAAYLFLKAFDISII